MSRGELKGAHQFGERLRAYFFFFFPLTSSLNAALALKTGALDAAIWIALPVYGLRPIRAIAYLFSTGM
jgi:hypothetical protein